MSAAEIRNHTVELKMEVRAASRYNGFSLPPHPLQFLVLTVIIYFSLIWYGINVSALPTSWQPAAYAVSFIESGVRLN